jgi:hypothetical protein
MIEWKRKGPKGCYRTVHEGRVVLLERARPPAEVMWLLHRPDGKGGLTTETLYAKTTEMALKTADALLSGK